MTRHVLAAGLLAAGLPAAALADVVHTDDVIISKGSASTALCVGRQCVVDETFDTTFGAMIKLKAQNTMIEFEDVSTLSSFPGRDWRIRANETSGGPDGEAFFIEDVDAGTTPFYIEGDAPDHALHVADSGRIGVRTMMPERDLHIVGGVAGPGPEA